MGVRNRRNSEVATKACGSSVHVLYAHRTVVGRDPDFVLLFTMMRSNDICGFCAVVASSPLTAL